MTKHVVCVNTAKTLLQAKNGRTWREFAITLGYARSYNGTLSCAAARIPGAMSKDAENELRTRLGLSPRARKPRKSLHLPPDLWDVLNRERAGRPWAQYLENIAIEARCYRKEMNGCA